jgi:glutaminase
MLGATIAADGVQPLSGNIVYNGTLSQHLVGLIAAKGVHKMNVPWLTAVGLPAKSSFGGAIVGIYPGVMAVAAISARLNKVGVSERGHRAIAALMQRLDINLFSSLHTEIIRG